MGVKNAMDQAAKGSRRAGNPGGRPARISRDDILREARLIPASGLTLPLIARRLGVQTASLYYHFASREALLTALSAQLIDELKVHPADPAHWRAWLGAEAREIYRFVLANPVMFEVASWPLIAGASTRLVETALETLVDAGFRHEDALLTWSAVSYFAFGQAQTVHNAAKAPPMAIPDAGEDLPHLGAARLALSGWNPDTLVDEMFDRFAALLAEP